MAKCNRFKPPGKSDVYIYFRLLDLSEKHSDAFYFYGESKGWRTNKGQLVKNWKVLAYNWILSFQSSIPFKKKRKASAKIVGHLFPIR